MVLRGLQEAVEDWGARGEVMSRWKRTKGRGGPFAHYRDACLVMRNSSQGAMPLFFLRARGSVDGVNVYIYLRTYV